MPVSLLFSHIDDIDFSFVAFSFSFNVIVLFSLQIWRCRLVLLLFVTITTFMLLLPDDSDLYYFPDSTIPTCNVLLIPRYYLYLSLLYDTSLYFLLLIWSDVADLFSFYNSNFFFSFQTLPAFYCSSDLTILTWCSSIVTVTGSQPV